MNDKDKLTPAELREVSEEMIERVMYRVYLNFLHDIHYPSEADHIFMHGMGVRL